MCLFAWARRDEPRHAALARSRRDESRRRAARPRDVLASTIDNGSMIMPTLNVWRTASAENAFSASSAPPRVAATTIKVTAPATTGNDLPMLTDNATYLNGGRVERTIPLLGGAAINGRPGGGGGGAFWPRGRRDASPDYPRRGRGGGASKGRSWRRWRRDYRDAGADTRGTS